MQVSIPSSSNLPTGHGDSENISLILTLRLGIKCGRMTCLQTLSKELVCQGALNLTNKENCICTFL